MSDSDDLHAIIADQAETIDQLRATITRYESGEQEPKYYYEGVYDRIRAAWDVWALAELGTMTPTPLDLKDRPELQQLWDSVK